MLNSLETKTRAIKFIDRYYLALSYLENATDKLSVSIAIDDKYDLAVMCNGKLIAIVEHETKEPVLYYCDEDEWTLGDILGGYIDLYNKG